MRERPKRLRAKRARRRAWVAALTLSAVLGSAVPAQAESDCDTEPLPQECHTFAFTASVIGIADPDGVLGPVGETVSGTFTSSPTRMGSYIRALPIMRICEARVLMDFATPTSLVIQSGQFPSFLMYRPSGRAMTASVTGNVGQFTICDRRGADHAKAVILDLSGRPQFSEDSMTGGALSCI